MRYPMMGDPLRRSLSRNNRRSMSPIRRARTISKYRGMLGTGISNADVFGLYELSSDGTVLYSRARREDVLSEPASEAIGQDFFRDIARFENTGALRHHFRRFLSDGRPVDSFLFDCLFESEVVRAKVFLTRAYEIDHDHAGGIVIMDIRQASQ